MGCDEAPEHAFCTRSACKDPNALTSCPRVVSHFGAQEWRIMAPAGYAYTPAEVAQIALAAQAFRDEVSKIAGGKGIHFVKLDDLCVLDGKVSVTWPQPEPWGSMPDPTQL